MNCVFSICTNQRIRISFQNHKGYLGGFPQGLLHYLADEKKAQCEHFQETNARVAEVEAVEAKHAEKDGQPKRRLEFVDVVGIDKRARYLLGNSKERERDESTGRSRYHLLYWKDWPFSFFHVVPRCPLRSRHVLLFLGRLVFSRIIPQAKEGKRETRSQHRSTENRTSFSLPELTAGYFFFLSFLSAAACTNPCHGTLSKTLSLNAYSTPPQSTPSSPADAFAVGTCVLPSHATPGRAKHGTRAVWLRVHETGCRVSASMAGAGQHINAA